MNFAVASSTPLAATPSSPSPEHRRLVAAAQQFEGVLLQEMLKPMQEKGFGEQEDDTKTDGGGYGDTLTSFGIESVAGAIAKDGGLGIARRVVAQVEGEAASREAKK